MISILENVTLSTESFLIKFNHVPKYTQFIVAREKSIIISIKIVY